MPADLTQSDTPATSTNQEVKVQSYADFAFAKVRIDKLLDDWKAIETETQRLRDMRYIRCDIKAMRDDKKLLPDEVFTPDRLIDSNIRAEEPQRIAYLTQSRRAAVLIPNDNALANQKELIEQDYTNKARYLGWQKPRIKVSDGASTHGWDHVEIVLDTSKPGHFSVEHVGHEKLIFNLDAEDLNNQELIIRTVEYSAIQLKKNVLEFSWTEEQVRKVIDSNDKNEQNTKDILYCVKKCFYRNLEDSTIFVGWYHEKADDWLKAPEPLYLGINDLETPVNKIIDGQPIQDFAEIHETDYPFYTLPYVESENPKITEIKGRAYLDEPDQEAASAIKSAIVNGNVRASGVYGAVENNPGDTNTASVKQIDTVIQSGKIYDKKVNFFHAEYPPASIVGAYQAVVSANKAQTSKVNHAAINKKDSRQTATAVASADEESKELGSVQTVLLSIFDQLVNDRCFKIYRNRCLQKKITIENEELYQLLQAEWEVKASGDTDVVKRKEKGQMYLQSWPVFSQIPGLNMVMLKDIIRVFFPEDAERYIAALDEQANPVGLVQAMHTIISAIVLTPDGQLQDFARPFAQQLAALEQEVQAFLSSSQALSSGGQPAKGSGKSQQPPQIGALPQLGNGSQEGGVGLGAGQINLPQQLAV